MGDIIEEDYDPLIARKLDGRETIAAQSSPDTRGPVAATEDPKRVFTGTLLPDWTSYCSRLVLDGGQG